jgi:hypothetical protein
MQRSHPSSVTKHEEPAEPPAAHCTPEIFDPAVARARAEVNRSVRRIGRTCLLWFAFPSLAFARTREKAPDEKTIRDADARGSHVLEN